MTEQSTKKGMGKKREDWGGGKKRGKEHEYTSCSFGWNSGRNALDRGRRRGKIGGCLGELPRLERSRDGGINGQAPRKAQARHLAVSSSRRRRQEGEKGYSYDKPHKTNTITSRPPLTRFMVGTCSLL